MSSRTACSTVGCGCALALTLLFVLRAVADEAWPSPSAAGAGPRAESVSVEFHVVGSEAALLSLMEALGTRRLGTATLRWSRADSFHPGELLRIMRVQKQLPRGRTIRCWIDLNDQNTARLYFVDPVHDRFMLRELELKHEFGSFDAETVAQIVELSVSALASDAAAGMNRKEAQQALAVRSPEVSLSSVSTTEVPTVRAPPETAKYAAEVAAGYGIRRYSIEVPWVMGPSVAIAATRTAWTHLSRLELAVGYELPRSFETKFGGVTISAWALRLRAECLLPMSHAPRLWLGANLAAGVDVVRATPSESLASGNYQHSTPRIDTPLVLSPGGVWLAELSGDVTFRLLIALEVTPKPIQHTLNVDGTTQVLTEAQHLRPSATLGLVFR